MNTDKLEIKTQIQIQKPVAAVFEEIVNPENMSNYFISKSSGTMKEGKTVTWHFPEYEEGFQVEIGIIAPNQSITFFWESNNKTTEVNITLTPKPGN
ncbi:MAG: hypothetical protein JW761_03215, partial [Prolixibacteraceae bacterium]|nr:hypothetical protein [Prolixibacteraceae bacterium]